MPHLPFNLFDQGPTAAVVDPNDIPDSPLERARMLENLLIARATGDMTARTNIYEHLRSAFMGEAAHRQLLPDFVRTCRSLNVFWPFIKEKSDTWAGRKKYIAEAFTPLISYLEDRNRSPADQVTSDSLTTFDEDGVHSVWEKALQRRTSDPEGAITVARTLLETVCKRILDEVGRSYSDKEDLPKLYAMTAKALNLAPDQHAEEAIKSILGGAINVVKGIGTLRNKLSDAHGRGGLPVRPTARHAAFAVNMAGAVAAFLVETYRERHKP
jgi:hypothetical protein